MKVCYGYKRDGEEKPVLLRNCTFDFDKVKGRLVLRTYDLCDKFKDADKMDEGSPYCQAIETNERKRFARFVETSKVYPMKYGLYVDRESVCMDVSEGKETLHFNLTSDIGKALRLEDDALGDWKGFKLMSKNAYTEDKR